MPVLLLPRGLASVPAAALFPAVSVEANFSVLTGWTNITRYVRIGGGGQIGIIRGSSRVESPVIRYETGTAVIPLDNRDRRFDPTNLGGPYTGGIPVVTFVKPCANVRVSATYASVTYRLFNGTADSWDLSYSPPQDAQATVSCSDGFRVLAVQARTARSSFQGGGEDAGARVSRILNDCGWPSAKRSIVPGDSTLQPTLLGGTPIGVVPLAVANAGGTQTANAQVAVSTLAPLDELQLTADTEMGELYVNGNGFLVFRNRHALWTSARSLTPQALFGDLAGTTATGIGAFLDQAGMGAADFNGANALWTGWTGTAMKSSRVFLGAPFTLPSRITQMGAAGIKICLNLDPAFNPVSATDLANISTLLAAMVAAGIQADVDLWQEPFFRGLSAAQYIAGVNYYGPTIRSYYPLVFCTAESSVHNNNENSYYPGDAAVDKVATDWYCINYFNGHTLDLAASIADNAVPPKPFGIYEFNALVNGGNFLIQPNSGFELAGTGSLGTWTTAGNSVLTLTSAQAHTGTYSMVMTSQAAGNMFAAHCLAANITTQGLACSPGDNIAATAWFKAATLGRTVQIGTQFYDSGGTFISALFGGFSGTDVTTGWTQVSAPTITAPASAAWCRAYIEIQSTGAINEVHWVDDITISNTSTGYSQAQIAAFFGYTQSYMMHRLANGKANGDILLFNGAGPNSTEISSASDFRVPLYQAIAASVIELPYASVTPAYDDSTLWNGATIANTGGNLQQAADATSQQLPPDGFGPHVYDSENLIADSDFQALGYAQYIVASSKNPELRFSAITIHPQRAPAQLFPQVLGREIGDRITITRRPPGGGSPNTRDVFIRGISHTITSTTWETTWVLEDATSLPPLLLLDGSMLLDGTHPYGF